MRWLLLLGWLLAAAPAAVIRAGDLEAAADGLALNGVTVAGQPLPLTLSVVARNPRTKAPADGFTIEGSWRAVDGYLRLDGLVTAPGDEDQVADLVIRVAGAELPLGTMADDPLLLPRKLLSRLPLVSLRAEGEDRLALAVPPDRLVLHSFAASEGGVELHFPFGFSRETKPDLRLRAPFACLLYSTDPRWHYRAALERYYGFFPEPFRPFTREHGGWFFAAETKDLPNPQHFRFHEGGPWGVDEDEARGLGTYPYRESSSATISLEGSQQPKDQAEAMARFEELERRRVPEGWQPQQAFTLDESKAFAGQRSLLADSGATGVWTGALQQVTLPQPEAGPITVSGRSKADGISGEPDNNYSIYVDAVLADGSYLFGQCASFSTGTHDWEESTFTFQAKQPVVSLRVFCLLRHHHGRAWFDEVRVGPAARPEVNWLRNSGFEELREPAEYRYIRDNLCLQPDGRWAFHITNNLSADVPPDAPMNLLRFSLNVDPDLPASDAHPTPASQTIAEFDSYFRQFPSIDGVYIDSVSAWCSYVYNTRQEHWPAADEPLTYDPRTLAVASHGRFAMMDYLRALQERYHPLGKAVFTNIHTEQASFPLYLVSDIPGIESSAFQDEEALFFYRASSYHKPLLLMNYLNLHKLDDREVALRFHLNAAQWGLLPSTGRGVQQAYRLYGDVTHRYLPAIAELSEAGWEPVPHTAGRAERFGRSPAAYFAVPGWEDSLVIEPAALTGLSRPLVAWDALDLRPLTLDEAEGRVRVTLPEGALRLVRVCGAAEASGWLVARARAHLVNHTRVRGAASADPTLTACAERLDSAAGRRAALELLAERTSGPAPEDLFALSARRELEAALAALRAVP